MNCTPGFFMKQKGVKAGIYDCYPVGIKMLTETKEKDDNIRQNN